MLTFRKRWFTTVAFEATLIVGNEETAEWYEQWIDETATFLLGDTLSVLRRRDPKADPAAPPFFSREDLECAENDLKFELIKMVANYNGAAARRVVEVLGLRKTQRTTGATGQENSVPPPAPAERNTDSSLVVATRDRAALQAVLNVSLISAWMDEEGWINKTLAAKLQISERTISSLRNNGNYHGMDAITKLANLMGRDPDELLLPEASS
jgi:hypothetical protein